MVFPVPHNIWVWGLQFPWVGIFGKILAYHIRILLFRLRSILEWCIHILELFCKLLELSVDEIRKSKSVQKSIRLIWVMSKFNSSTLSQCGRLCIFCYSDFT